MKITSSNPVVQNAMRCVVKNAIDESRLKFFDTATVCVIHNPDGTARCTIESDIFSHDVPRMPVGMTRAQAKRMHDGMIMCLADLKKAIAFAEKTNGKPYDKVKV